MGVEGGGEGRLGKLMPSPLGLKGDNLYNDNGIGASTEEVFFIRQIWKDGITRESLSLIRLAIMKLRLIKF